MFLETTLARNPELVETAIALIRDQRIEPNTFVIDLDRVADNARLIADEAARLGLSLHFMTKQQGRNPFLAAAARAAGIPDAVAVDVPEARLLNGHGIEIGHVGHLVQVPARDTGDVVAMRPGAVTVFSVEAARRVSEAALEVERVQDVLLRVWKPGDFLYPGQEGGFRVDQMVGAARQIMALPGVRIAGVTSFPCLYWESGALVETGNLDSIHQGAAILRDDLDLELREINAPGVTCVSTLPRIAARGATHGEPGSSLSGHTPLHADGSQPEMPAMVYASEIASVGDSRAYCFGGGFYARSRVKAGVVASRDGQRVLEAPALPPEVIDYYGWLELGGGRAPDIGDPVVFAFRSQVFVGRCQVAAVAGLASDSPRVVGICDQHGNVLGEDQLPVGTERARAIVAGYASELVAGGVA